MFFLLWIFFTFIIALSLLITVHEFGHFLLARFYNVFVERFSIGFGTILLNWYDKRGTEYVISAIPLGGYVKMLEDKTTINVISKNCCKSFHCKKIWQRIIIIISGPMFNFLFAIFAYFLVFLIGMPTYRPIIGKVFPNSIASKAEIVPGMEIKSVDDVITPDWDSVFSQLMHKIGNEKTVINVTSLYSIQHKKKILNLHDWKFNFNNKDIFISLGIIPFNQHIEPIIDKIQKNSDAEIAGLKVNDKIVKVNGYSVSTWWEFIKKMSDNSGYLSKISVERYGNIIDIVMKINVKSKINGKMSSFAGIIPKNILLPLKYSNVKKYNPLLSIYKASKKTWQLIKTTVIILGKLMTGSIKLNNINGPISIAQYAGKSAEYGLVYYLMFLALISVNLGVINLFPLPILDGGHIVFLIIEKINGKPISEKIKDISYRISSILLILLMSFVFLNDFSRLF